ncbi:MAG: TonB family protein [Acidobacteria bacterium]|nr:TonB family protein [Acidobacteriota bacterium]
MFEFAISRNKRPQPSKRIVASWIGSFFVHLFLLILLVQFPELLRGGRFHDFRPLALLTRVAGPEADDDDRNWRTVAVLRTPMIAPSAARLRELADGLNSQKKGEGAPPIKIRFGNEEKEALKEDAPAGRIRLEPKPQSAEPLSAAAVPPPVETAPELSEVPSLIKPDPVTEKKGDLNIALNKAPAAIPDIPKPTPVPAKPKEEVKVFEDEQKAIRSQESGFFDTKGFPLGEYAILIKERIQERWFIPSNLRDSRGQTTIIFYIEKDGRYRDCRIVSPSGNTSLDLAALKAVMDSNPFPPLPKGFPGDHIGAKFVLSYNEPQ